MHKKLVEFNLEQRKKDMPKLKTGDVVKVHRRIQEAGKERIQVFEGMIIAIRGRQSSSPMITVRKVSYGVGVEIVVPVYSPLVKEIELVKRAKVRRSKLYYVREKTAKALRFKFTDAADLKEGDKKGDSKKVESEKNESGEVESEKSESEKVESEKLESEGTETSKNKKEDSGEKLKSEESEKKNKEEKVEEKKESTSAKGTTNKEEEKK